MRRKRTGEEEGERREQEDRGKESTIRSNRKTAKRVVRKIQKTKLTGSSLNSKQYPIKKETATTNVRVTEFRGTSQWWVFRSFFARIRKRAIKRSGFGV